MILFLLKTRQKKRGGSPLLLSVQGMGGAVWGGPDRYVTLWNLPRCPKDRELLPSNVLHGSRGVWRKEGEGDLSR